MTDGAVPPARRWAITIAIMFVTVMQILDTSVTNVALPHMQGSLSAGVEEMSWVLTSYLAANAVVIPATGWLSALLGRRRFFLMCTVMFTVSSFLSGIAPNLTLLVLARVFQGLGGGPVIPMAQAIMWEIFPLEQRGMATAVWGIGVMMGPILGPTIGGWITDNWSWRWIFYINLPIGLFGFFMASAFLFDQTMLAGHVTVWNPETAERLQEWTSHFLRQGAEASTAQQQAMAMLYRQTVQQAQVLAYAEEFWLLSVVFLGLLLLLPLMRRVRADAPEPGSAAAAGRVAELPAAE